MSSHSKKIHLYLQKDSVGFAEYLPVACSQSCSAIHPPSDKNRNAFSLVETMTALAILALICSSVVVVVNRCTAAAADSKMQMQAFEVTRENMEILLTNNSVNEMTDYGISDKYPQITWQTTVEVFPEPVTSRMWVQAVCSSQYTDTDGQMQTIELTHWLTGVSKKQMIQIIEQKQAEQERLLQLAADQLEQQPGPEDQPDQPEEPEKPEQAEQQEPENGQKTPPEKEEKLYGGYTMEQLNQMTFQELWQILMGSR